MQSVIDTIARSMAAVAGEEWENVAYSPYSIATIINAVFVEMGSDKQVKPQMMYNYARNGLINTIKGQKQYTAEDAAAFIIRYVNRNINK
jgi:hypothetical protein